ncbi:MAG: transposase [Deltaproteobacteria bacterium]|jgi:putative transposase|nr:transposase [Deltaproteobacteria bacterium]MBT4091911.1 transposase [Deltaproteobacteria bacterium]MBT4263079.1 transposase [Deltaproteobacteria bacterium]MBT4643430.1 transposase [Deltaproteobacteria bacterium]MBT6502479.1 transposase [Deltaproteobacteria bacterium]
MSRPLRIEYKNAWYHIMNRGRRQEMIFHDDHDPILFKDLLKESTELWGVNICAYCLMPNHYHLLVQTPQANLSRFMRHVNGIYTQRFNRYHKSDGSLFRGRYKSILVGEENYLLDLIRYIHFNPCKAKLVKTPEEYKWSSYTAYVNESNDEKWLRSDLILDMLHMGKRSKKNVRDLMKNDGSDDIYSFFKKKNLPSLLGSQEFVDRIRSDFFKPLVHPEIPESKQTTQDAQTIIKEVASFFKIDSAELFVKRRGKENLPRDLTIYLTRMKTALSLSEIGKIFGIESYSTVSNSIERINKKTKSDRRLVNTIKKLKSRLA